MFKEMNYVYAVYMEKNFTKAAQKLYISQPALSTMVKKAELKIGMPIFDRTTNPITLTPAGQYYIEQAKKIMQIQKESEAHFKIMSSTNANTLRLGGSSFFLTYTFPPVFARFKTRFPDVQVSYMELRNDELLGHLLENKIDFFFEVNDISDNRLDRIVWGEENLLIAVPSSFAVNDLLLEYALTAEDVHNGIHLLPDTPAVDLWAFHDEPFILLRPGHDTYNRAVSMCEKAGFSPRAMMSTDQILSSYYLAAEGYGIAFIRDSILLNKDLSENLLFYKVDDPLAVRSIYLYYTINDLRPITRSFLDFIIPWQNLI